MLMVNEIIEKLKDILSQDGKNGKIFDKDVASALSLSQVNFATMKNRGKIPLSNILDFCAKKKISINWLLYNQSPNSLIQSTDKYWIKYYPNILVSAGAGAYENKENYESLEIPPYFINMLGGEKNLKNIEAINVIGDSMEPTLSSDNIVFLDKSKNTIFKQGIYAFIQDDTFFVKRIKKRKDERLDIISDNTIYKDKIISINDIKILGKITNSFGLIY